MAGGFFTLPLDSNLKGFDTKDVSAFSEAHFIKKIQSEFFILNGVPYWTICIEYEGSQNDSHKPQDLPIPEGKEEMYQMLKEWRRTQAGILGFPVYIVCTNQQLHDILLKVPQTKETLSQIQGFGKKKIDQFGNQILEITAKFKS